MKSISKIHFAATALYLASNSLMADSGPAFQLLRAEEDYSYLADQETRSGWERWKYLPLLESDSIWLSFGGESRTEYEFYENEDFGLSPNDNDGYLLFRNMVYADLHLGEHLRLFSQLQSANISGRDGGPRPPDRDELSFHQLFGEVHLPFDNLDRAQVRIGRQEIQYGSGCLISTREGANTRRSFDGVTTRFDSGPHRIDAFWLQPVDVDEGVFDNEVDNDRDIAGIFYTQSPSHIVDYLNLYIIRSTDDTSNFAGLAGDEERYSIGARIQKRHGGFDSVLEVTGQFGEQAGQDIRAWFAATEIGYTWDELPLQPRLALRAGVTSGDSDPNDGKLETFNPLYPNLSYYGEITLLGPANLIDLHPKLTLQLRDDMELTVGAVAYWRESTEDALYNAGIQIERAAAGSDARYAGTQADALLAWQANDFLNIELSYGLFEPGEFIEDTGLSETVHFFNTAITIQF